MRIRRFSILVLNADLIPHPGVDLGVGGWEDDHVGHEDDDAGTEHGHDDCEDDVKLTVFLGIVI